MFPKNMVLTSKDGIAETPTYNDRPYENQVMKTVTVDTFGVDYPEPEKV